VLAPWLEVDPDAWLPGHGTVAKLPAAVAGSGIRRLDSPRLSLPGPEAAGVHLGVAPCK
jgi:2-amino-4-hydroxy-6-hydroxymethyldihydropteridine diphosphokinase